jgi:NAD(P)-dependent dehydrogenase (short-subunit alcohol dehydrogenase family)
VALPLDMNDLPAVAEAIGQKDPFDVLLNNAGMNRPMPFVDVTLADFDAIMSLNVRSAFFAAQAVARRLISAGRSGSIINVSSQMGHVGGADRTVYCASKFAVEGMTRAMAVELGPHGIRANTLCPTYIETPMTAPYFMNAAFKDRVLSKIKLGRLGQVEDLTGAIVFLASDASSLMTGSSLIVDGGWTAE